MTILLLLSLVIAPVVYFAGRLVRGGWLPWMLAIAGLLATAGLWAGVAVEQLPAAAALGTVTFHMDGTALVLSGLAIGLGFLASLYSGPALPRAEKYYALVLALTGTIVGLVSTTDLFSLWLWFEAMTISTIFLVAFHREEGLALEAGFKYLVQSAVGSGFIVLGIALTLAQQGDLTLSQPASLTPALLFMVGFGVKAALVPLHTWLPDAHAQAPSPISALLSGVVIEAALIALIKALGGAQLDLLLVFAVLNMVAGNLLALQQTNIKRMLAYSSLVHVGYILMALGLGTAAGLQAGLFHMVTHGLMKGAAFLAAGVFLHALCAPGQPLSRRELVGAGRHLPLPAFVLALALLSLGGLPPLAGFMSKWQVFAAAAQSGFTLLVIVAALNSVLSLGYYGPVVLALYRAPVSVEQPHDAPARWERIPLVAAAAAIVIVGIVPVSLLIEPLILALGGLP